METTKLWQEYELLDRRVGELADLVDLSPTRGAYERLNLAKEEVRQVLGQIVKIETVQKTRLRALCLLATLSEADEAKSLFEEVLRIDAQNDMALSLCRNLGFTDVIARSRT